MRVTVIRDDGVVGVDGVFRAVDLTTMEEGVRVIQWDGNSGHKEFFDTNLANQRIETIAAIQSFIDLWAAAAPPPPPEPTPEQRRTAAIRRINAAYDAAVAEFAGENPQYEIDNWARQEAEARAYLADPESPARWLRQAAAAQSMNPANFAARIIRRSEITAPALGALAGKREALRDQIAGMIDPTQEQLDAIQW